MMPTKLSFLYVGRLDRGLKRCEGERRRLLEVILSREEKEAKRALGPDKTAAYSVSPPPR